MREVGSDTLIKIQNAAEILEVTKQTIYHWIKVKKIVHFKLFFKVIRFKKDEIMKQKNRVI